MPKKITEAYWWTTQSTEQIYPYNSLPYDLELDETTGKITGKPECDVGTYKFNVQCKTNYGQSEAVPITINVMSGLSITTTTLPSATAFSEYSAQVNLNKSGDYEFEMQGLPEGLDYDYRTGKITGTPYTLLGETTIYTVTVRVYNSSGNLRAIKDVSLTVRVTNGITTSLDAADIHVEYSGTVKLKSPSEEVSCSVKGLPAGLYYTDYAEDGTRLDNGTVRIAGSPTEEYAEDKTYTLKIEFFKSSNGSTVAYCERELKVLGMYPHLKGNALTLEIPIICARESSGSHYYVYTPSTAKGVVFTFYVIHGSLQSEGVNSVSYKLGLNSHNSLNIWGPVDDRYADIPEGCSNYYYLQKNSNQVYGICFEDDVPADTVIMHTTSFDGTAHTLLPGQYADRPSGYSIELDEFTITTNWGTLSLNAKLKCTF